MKIIIKIILPIIYGCFLFVQGCSSSNKIYTMKNVNVAPVELHAWIDLMPGKPSTVHFSGVLKITNNGKEKLDKLELNTIEVFQSGNVLYRFKPEFSSGSGITGEMLPGDSKLFKFNTKKGLKSKAGLNAGEPVAAMLSFSAGEMNFTYKIDSLNIQKVY